MLDERMRHRLHGRLEEVLGADEAAALMSALPQTELATKADLDAVEVRLRGEMVEGFASLRIEIAGVRSELHQTITAQTRQMFFGLVGVVATFGGLMITVARMH